MKSTSERSTIFRDQAQLKKFHPSATINIPVGMSLSILQIWLAMLRIIMISMSQEVYGRVKDQERQMKSWEDITS